MIGGATRNLDFSSFCGTYVRTGKDTFGAWVVLVPSM